MLYLKTLREHRVLVDANRELRYPSFVTDTFDKDEYNKAFQLGEEAFKNGKTIDDNPYLDEIYPNKTLIDKWEEGYLSGEINA